MHDEDRIFDGYRDDACPQNELDMLFLTHEEFSLALQDGRLGWPPQQVEIAGSFAEAVSAMWQAQIQAFWS